MAYSKRETQMRSTRLLVATLLFAFPCYSHSTDAQNPSTDTSADTWFSGCKAFVEGHAIDSAEFAAENFCSGMVTGLASVGQLLPSNMQFCPPWNSTARELARVVVQYIEAQPERMHEDFRTLTLQAFHKAWPGPCKPGR